MPDHVHGIIIIDKNDNEKSNTISKNNTVVDTSKLDVSTTTKSNKKNVQREKWKPGVLGVIINQYKRIVTINARKINPDFGWQSRFYDHIIRNDRAFWVIENYILNNPINWEKNNSNIKKK